MIALWGNLVGCFLPKEGANKFALALIDVPSPAAYEQYRARLARDADAKQGLARRNPAAYSRRDSLVPAPRVIRSAGVKNAIP